MLYYRFSKKNKTKQGLTHYFVGTIATHGRRLQMVEDSRASDTRPRA